MLFPRRQAPGATLPLAWDSEWVVAHMLAICSVSELH